MEAGRALQITMGAVHGANEVMEADKSSDVDETRWPVVSRLLGGRGLSRLDRGGRMGRRDAQYCTTVGKARVRNYHFTEESREFDLFFLTLQVLNLFSPLSVYLLR